MHQQSFNKNFVASVVRFYQPQTIDSFLMPSLLGHFTITLVPSGNTLQAVNIRSKKPPIQFVQGKTILNVDVTITNTGTTVLEVLEKSPWLMVHRNDGISLQGKAGVLYSNTDDQ